MELSKLSDKELLDLYQYESNKLDQYDNMQMGMKIL